MPTPEEDRAERLETLGKFTGTDLFFRHCGQTWGVTSRFTATTFLCPVCGELMMATTEKPGA